MVRARASAKTACHPTNIIVICINRRAIFVCLQKTGIATRTLLRPVVSNACARAARTTALVFFHFRWKFQPITESKFDQSMQSLPLEIKNTKLVSCQAFGRRVQHERCVAETACSAFCRQPQLHPQLSARLATDADWINGFACSIANHLQNAIAEINMIEIQCAVCTMHVSFFNTIKCKNERRKMRKSNRCELVSWSG